jgi:hypothetical protein
VAKVGALLFARPRDNGANELRRIFREGSPSLDICMNQGGSKATPRMRLASRCNVIAAPHIS